MIKGTPGMNHILDSIIKIVDKFKMSAMNYENVILLRRGESEISNFSRTILEKF